MYSYYFLSSFEGLKNVVLSFKLYVTMIQIVQLVLLLAQSLLILIQSGSIVFLGSAINDLVLLYLFVSFYLQSYSRKSKNKMN